MSLSIQRIINAHVSYFCIHIQLYNQNHSSNTTAFRHISRKALRQVNAVYPRPCKKLWVGTHPAYTTYCKIFRNFIVFHLIKRWKNCFCTKFSHERYYYNTYYRKVEAISELSHSHKLKVFHISCNHSAHYISVKKLK